MKVKIQRIIIDYTDSENVYKNLQCPGSEDPVEWFCNFLVANDFADEISMNKTFSVSKMVMKRVKGEKV